MRQTKSRTGKRTAAAEERAFLDVLRTAEALSYPLAQLLKTYDLSLTQYNVLRILRGSPEGLTCGDIASRMITRDPDITRLLDRLEKRKLAGRARDEKDRRVVLTRITADGLDLLELLDGPVQEAHEKLLGHMGAERLAQLAALLAECRGNVS